MNRVSGIYDSPELYELACAYRDVRSEVDALDLNAAMCAWAREKGAAAQLKLDVVQADMRDFSLAQPVDLAITMLNSACHLMTLDDLVAHLGAVGRAVTPGGLYVIELAHPADFLTLVPRTSSEWDSEVGTRRVHVRWGGGEDVIDPVTQVTREHVQVVVRDGAGVRTLADVVPNRFWTGTEVAAAVRLAGHFSLVASYGDFTDDVGLSDREAWRMIFVLRRD